jgi:CMP-N-acetylneuraminic acid synthetase
LIKIGFEQKININSFQIDPKEAMGINSKEELEIAESIIV